MVEKYDDYNNRGIGEALSTRKEKNKMNRDESRYRLSPVYNTRLRSEPRGPSINNTTVADNAFTDDANLQL